MPQPRQHDHQPIVDLTAFALVLRLVLAGLVGGLIGYERRLHRKRLAWRG